MKHCANYDFRNGDSNRLESSIKEIDIEWPVELFNKESSFELPRS